MTVYEFYFDLRHFKMSGFYILVVQKETPKTLRGNVFYNHDNQKPFDRFIIQKDRINQVESGKYGGVQQLKTYVVANTNNEAIIMAKELFANFLIERANRLKKE